MSVCWYPINAKTAEPIGPKFFVGPRMDDRIFEICLHHFLFLKILKIRNKLACGVLECPGVIPLQAASGAPILYPFILKNTPK